MISFAAGFIILILLTVSASSYFKLPTANTYMTVLLGVALLLYLFSFVGLMNIGYYLIALVASICIIYCIANYKIIVTKLFCVPMIILYTLMAFSLLINSAVYTVDNEVISYWLPGLEFILENDKLPYAEDNLLPQEILHPPLLWLLQYFMLFNSDSEVISAVNTANNLLAFACILPFFGNDKPSNRYDAMIIVVKFILVFGLFGTDNGFTDLSVGRLFALLFGYGIFIATTKPCNKRFEVTELSFILSGVMLLNSTGFAFSFIILLVARIMAFFSSQEKNLIRKTFRAAKEHFAATIVLTITSCSFILLLFLSGNTEPVAAVASIFNALGDFVYWFPYTLSVLAILLLPALGYNESGEKRLKV